MATYTVIPDGTGAFAVEIQHSGGVQITGGFKTESDAKTWMVERQAMERGQLADVCGIHCPRLAATG
jgi:hypothetical protein